MKKVLKISLVIAALLPLARLWAGFLPFYLDAPSRNNPHDPRVQRPLPTPFFPTLTSTPTPSPTLVPAGSTFTATPTPTPSFTVSSTFTQTPNLVPTPRIVIHDFENGLSGVYNYGTAVGLPAETNPGYNSLTACYIQLATMSSWGGGLGFLCEVYPLDVSTARTFVMMIKTDKPLMDPYITLTNGSSPNFTFKVQVALPNINASPNWQNIQVPVGSFKNFIASPGCTYATCPGWVPASGDQMNNFDIQFVNPTDGSSDNANIYLDNIGFN